MIQIATEKDIPIIQDIANHAWYPAYGTILTDEQSEYMLEMMYSTDSLSEQMHANQVFALLYNTADNEPNTVVGFVSFELHYHNEIDLAKIHKLYLLPEAKGKGLGAQLIEYIVNIAKSNNISRISLNMNKHNPSYGFYQHIGFEKVKEENIHIGNGFVMEDFVLEKKL